MSDTPIVPEPRVPTGDLEPQPIPEPPAKEEPSKEMTRIQKMAPTVDKYLGRFVSKKLMVLIIGCVFLYLGKLPADDWMAIAMTYIGGQSAIDAALAWKRGKRV